MLTKQYFVYIMANAPNGTLYIGVTSDLVKRDYEHKQGMVEDLLSAIRLPHWFIMKYLMMCMKPYVGKEVEEVQACTENCIDQKIKSILE